MLKCLLIALFVSFLSPSKTFAAADKPARLTELDRFWQEVSRSVREGDFVAYTATCHPQGVLVSAAKQVTSPLSVALARWQKEFTATQAGTLKANVEFRFSQRLGDETTAHETGIFDYSSTGADGVNKHEYIHFEILLLKTNGRWQTLMEHQKTPATVAEWAALGQGP